MTRLGMWYLSVIGRISRKTRGTRMMNTNSYTSYKLIEEE